MGRRAVAVALTGLAVAAVPAHAAWLTTGGGTGAAHARSLAGPGHITSTGATASTVSLSWGAAPALPGGQTTYLVERAPFAATTGWVAACGSSTAVPIDRTSCTDTGLAAGTEYHYRVTSLVGKWRQPGTPSGKITTSAAAPAPRATALVFSDCPSAPIGRPGTRQVTVLLHDAQGARIASGPGGVVVTLSSSNLAAGSASPSPVTIPAGSSASATVTINSTPSNGNGNQSFTVTASAAGLTDAVCAVTK